MLKKLHIITFLLLVASPVQATITLTQCAPHVAVVKTLLEKYRETKRSVITAANGLVMETFSSEATGTWTIIVTTPEGWSCLVAIGTGVTAKPLEGELL